VLEISWVNEISDRAYVALSSDTQGRRVEDRAIGLEDQRVAKERLTQHVADCRGWLLVKMESVGRLENG